MARTVEKAYLAVCRGWPDEHGEIDYPLPGVRETRTYAVMEEVKHTAALPI